MASLKKHKFVVLVPKIGWKTSSVMVPQPQENTNDELMKKIKR
jgi:hypothetical protein